MPLTPNSPYFVYVDEKLDSRVGSPFGAGGRRNYQRKWLVKLRDNNLGANIVCTAPGVSPYAPYATEDGKEWDYQALCIDIRLEPPVAADDGFHRIVVAEYSTEMPSGGPPVFTAFGKDAFGSQNNPQLEPPHIEWEGDSVREAPQADLDGKPYLTSAFMPYKPSPTFETGRAILVYARNELSHDARKQIRYSYAVNSDTFLGEAPGTCQLMAPRAVLMWRGPISYWRVTYRFRFNNTEIPAVANRLMDPNGQAVEQSPADAGFNAPLRTWQPKILDAGLSKIQSVWSGGPFFNLPVPIVRGHGAITEPVLLDGAGGELRRNSAGKLVPVYNQYRQFPSLPFTPLLVFGVGMIS